MLQKQGVRKLLLLFACLLLQEHHSLPRSWASVTRFDIVSTCSEYKYLLYYKLELKVSNFISLQLGAFLAGALLAETNYRTQIEADIRPFRGLLLGLFFVTTGTSIDMQVLPYVSTSCDKSLFHSLIYFSVSSLIVCRYNSLLKKPHYPHIIHFGYNLLHASIFFLELLCF